MLFPDLWKGSGRLPQWYTFHTANSRARSWSGSWLSPWSAGNECTNLAAAWHRSTGHFSSFVGDLQPSKSFSIHASTSSCAWAPLCTMALPWRKSSNVCWGRCPSSQPTWQAPGYGHEVVHAEHIWHSVFSQISLLPIDASKFKGTDFRENY